MHTALFIVVVLVGVCRSIPLYAGPCDVTIPCQVGNVYGDPDSCFTYYECNVNAYFDQKTCQGGRIFNYVTKQCTYAAGAPCQPPCHLTTVSTTIPPAVEVVSAGASEQEASTAPPAPVIRVTRAKDGEAGEEEDMNLIPGGDDAVTGKELLPGDDPTTSSTAPQPPTPPPPQPTQPPTLSSTVSTTNRPSPTTTTTPAPLPPIRDFTTVPDDETSTGLVPPPPQNAGLSWIAIGIMIAVLVVIVVVVAVIVIYFVYKRRIKRKYHTKRSYRQQKEQPRIENPIYRQKQPLPPEATKYRFSRDSKLVLDPKVKRPLIANNNGIYAIPTPQKPRAPRIPVSVREKRRAPAPPNPFTGEVENDGYAGLKGIRERESDDDLGVEATPLQTFGDNSNRDTTFSSNPFDSDSDDDEEEDEFNSSFEDNAKADDKPLKNGSVKQKEQTEDDKDKEQSNKDSDHDSSSDIKKRFDDNKAGSDDVHGDNDNGDNEDNQQQDADDGDDANRTWSSIDSQQSEY